MPDYTVKADVDSMLRADNDAGIRSAIGLGQTDAPTFLAQSLTGQSLTGVQATSLVDLATTWNTSGTPTAIKLNVVETGINSNASSLLMDLRVGGVSKFLVTKAGVLSFDPYHDIFTSTGLPLAFRAYHGVKIQRDSTSAQSALFVTTPSAGFGDLFRCSTLDGGNVVNGTPFTVAYDGAIKIGGTDTILARDAPGILAQRNVGTAQTFRVYNSTDASPATNFDRASFGFTSNVLRIGTENGGTYATARGIDFVTGGTRRGGFVPGGNFDVAVHFICPGFIYCGTTPNQSSISAAGSGILRLGNAAANDFTRLELGEANMGIMRGAGTPEGVVTGKVGSIFLRTDGGTSTTLYVKESGTGNTGWAAK
jgi:hypothetical protein